MPVKKDPSGRRSVDAEVEVPGTPEEVWRAIATGPGVSSWFVPTHVDERVGGDITANFGPNMDSSSKITAWDPPRRLVADSKDAPGPEAPTIATEWIVEARAGGTCVVRVVHSWFSEKDDWDESYEQTQYGWQAFFRILRLYLTHFRDQHGTCVQVMPSLGGPKDQAWAQLLRTLGIERPERGQTIAARKAAPQLAGHVERVGEGFFPEELLLRLEKPAPGIAHLFALPMAGQVFLPIRLYLFGERAKDIAKEQEVIWTKFLQEQLQPPKAS